MKKFSIILIFLLALIPILSACSASQDTAKSTNDSSQKVYKIKIAHASPATNDRLEESLQAFKKEVEEKSNGAIVITTHPASQLGGEREELEGVQMGSIEMAALSTGPFPGIFPEIMTFDLPYLFKNEEIAYKVLDGPVGQEILDLLLEKTGVRGLAWGENGLRNFTNNVRPITKPEDLQGLKIRTMENPAHMAMVESMGADPTPMAFGEVYTSLQQGVIDGQENPVSLIESMRFYEVNKYLTLDGHIYNPYILIINEDFYQSLTENLKEIVNNAAKNWSNIERDLNKKQIAKGVNNLKEYGMEITTLTVEQKEAFVQATQPAYDYIRKEIGDELVNKVIEAVKDAEKSMK